MICGQSATVQRDRKQNYMEAIKLEQLNPEQIAQLAKQLKDARKAKSGDPKKRNTVIDRMLQEKDGNDWKHTTSDILVQLQADKVVASDLNAADKAAELKRIQTRKQLMVKKFGKEKYGYKISANGFAVTLSRVVTWLKNTATADDKKAVKAALK